MNPEKLRAYDAKMFTALEKIGKHAFPTKQGMNAVWATYRLDKPDQLVLIVSRPTPSHDIRKRAWNIISRLYKHIPCYYYSPKSGFELIDDSFNNKKWKGLKATNLRT